MTTSSNKSYVERPPDRSEELYNSLFENEYDGFDKTLEIISDGLAAFLENAERLMQDGKFLGEKESFASAAFLLTTAEEEIAKSYILLDMCRLDFSRRQKELKHLCKAFYDHIKKYAYYKVIQRDNFHRFFDYNVYLERGDSHGMKHIKGVWDNKVIKWWPGDHESGEPDLPHETYFIREAPLYVDFSEYSRQWYRPYAEKIELSLIGGSAFNYRLSDLQKELDRLRTTYNAKLYSTKSLLILNDIFKKHYISENTRKLQITLPDLYKKVAQQIKKKLNIQEEKFNQSALREWPLYSFV